MPRQPRERVFTLSTVEAWLDANDEKDDDDDERRETLTGLLGSLLPARGASTARWEITPDVPGGDPPGPGLL